MIYSLAPLDPNALQAVQKLEREIGVPLVAMSGIEAQAQNVRPDDLEKIQDLEKQLGVVLLAVE